MNRLYRFLACSLIAAGAQLSVGAQALSRSELPFNNYDACFVKVGNPAGQVGYIRYNKAEDRFDLVASELEADLVYFELQNEQDNTNNKFCLSYIGEGSVTLGAANANAGTYPKAVEDNEKLFFQLEKNGADFKLRATTGGNGYLSNYMSSNKLAFSNENNEEATVSLETPNYVNLYNKAKERFKPFAENNYTFGNTLGTYYRANYTQALDAYNQPVKNASEYETKYNILKSFLIQVQLNMPQPGDFFRIQSTANGAKFLSINAGANGVLEAVDNADDNTLFYFDGKKLTSYATGQGLVNDNDDVKPATLGETVNNVTFAENDEKTNYIVKTGDRTLLLSADASSVSSSANPTATASTRNLKLVPVNEVKLNIGDKGYATFFAHRAMKLSDTSVKIYVAKKTSATQVELVELEDHIIPAATAVILQADGAKELTLTVTNEEGQKAKTTDNVLKGYGYSQKATAGKATYALAFNTQENKVMFGLVENGVALPAFKAYIEVDNAAGAAAPLFIALPTAVEAAKVQNTKAGATYDLTGRRVQQTAKGQVYVRDGKKFVQQ
jgi:hypothetical protein